VNLQFSAADATNATALQLDGTSFLSGDYSFITGLHGRPTDDEDRQNVPQALSPISSGAHLRSVHVKKHLKKHHKRHHNRH
jgi:hypothetical protein